MAFNQNSRTVNAGRNAASAFINKTVILVLTFISRKLFIQYIGVEYLGINGLFSNILTLLSLADLGVGIAINVSLYKPIAEKDTDYICALLTYFRKIYHYISIAVFTIGLALIPLLPYVVNMDRDIPHLYVYYVMFVTRNALSYLYSYKQSIIKADQKTYEVNRIELIVQIVKILVEMVIIVVLKSYFFFVMTDIITVLVNNLILSHVANRNYPFIRERRELPPGEKKNIFSNVSSVFLYRVSYILLNGTDNVLMSILIGTIYVGLYSNYLSITTAIETFLMLLFNSLTASIGNLVATTDADSQFRTFKTMQMVGFWLCGIVSVCMFFLTQDFITLWLGKDMLLDNLTLIAIVLNLFFSTCMRPVWAFREGTGMYRQIRFVMLATAVLNIVFSVILGKLIGISGILFATSLSKVLTYFWYEPTVLFRKFFKQDIREYYGPFLMNAVLMVLCGAVCWIPIRLIGRISVLTWLLKAVICMIVVNAVYFLRYYKTGEFENLKAKAGQIIGSFRQKISRR